MRKLLLLLLLAGPAVFAQENKPKEDTKHKSDPNAPYTKYKDLPAFEAVYMNGKDTFNTFNIPKGKPSLIIYFSPDCDHCKKMLDEMLPQFYQLKNVNVYMMTFMPPIALQVFNRAYHLENYEAVKFIGQDFKFFFPTYYGVSSVPDIVLYDKNKRFVKLWPDVATMDEILAEVKKVD